MDRKTMDSGNLMDFVQRFRQLQVQRDTSDELIKVRCVLAALLLRRPSWDSLTWAGSVSCLPARGRVTRGPGL